MKQITRCIAAFFALVLLLSPCAYARESQPKEPEQALIEACTTARSWMSLPGD